MRSLAAAAAAAASSLTPRRRLVPDTVSNAEGSCLARTGRTSVLGGVKLLVSPPDRAAPSLGLLRLTLDLPQASDATARPGRCVARPPPLRAS